MASCQISKFVPVYWFIVDLHGWEPWGQGLHQLLYPRGLKDCKAQQSLNDNQKPLFPQAYYRLWRNSTRNRWENLRDQKRWSFMRNWCWEFDIEKNFTAKWKTLELLAVSCDRMYNCLLAVAVTHRPMRLQRPQQGWGVMAMATSHQKDPSEGQSSQLGAMLLTFIKTWRCTISGDLYWRMIFIENKAISWQTCEAVEYINIKTLVLSILFLLLGKKERSLTSEKMSKNGLGFPS